MGAGWDGGALIHCSSLPVRLLLSHASKCFPSITWASFDLTPTLKEEHMRFLFTGLHSVILFCKLWSRNLMQFPHFNNTIKQQPGACVLQYKLAFLSVFKGMMYYLACERAQSRYHTQFLIPFSFSLSLSVSLTLTPTHTNTLPTIPSDAQIQASMASGNLSSLHKSCNSIS